MNCSDQVNNNIVDGLFTFQLQQAREQEMRASEEAIHKLQEEEERLVRSLEYQALQDEELARKIVSEEREQVNV